MHNNEIIIKMRITQKVIPAHAKNLAMTVNAL
jgi:hypothetical protein